MPRLLPLFLSGIALFSGALMYMNFVAESCLRMRQKMEVPSTQADWQRFQEYVTI
uniref:Uncharacterized protein n=1 Tax=Arundo donax TaxID=35708 RepID=A0A0A8YXU1_ARUDO